MGSATLRFLLPTFLCYLVAGCWVLHLLAQRLGRAAAWSLALTVLVVQAATGVGETWLQTLVLSRRGANLAAVTATMAEQVPPGSVVITNNFIAQHLDMVRDWRLADPMIFSERGRAMAQRLTRSGGAEDNTPRPMQSAKLVQQAETYAGMRPLEREAAVARDLTAWADGWPIYYVGKESELEAMRGMYFNARTLHIVARVTLPAVPQERRNDMGGMGGPPGGPPEGGGDQGQGPPQGGGPGGEFGGPLEGQGAQGMARAGMGVGQTPGAQAFQQRRARGGGGGMMGYLDSATEIVIAEWTARP
jgi:hypothetical protein